MATWKDGKVVGWREVEREREREARVIHICASRTHLQNPPNTKLYNSLTTTLKIRSKENKKIKPRKF